MKRKSVKSLSHVRPFVTPWAVAKGKGGKWQTPLECRVPKNSKER